MAHRFSASVDVAGPVGVGAAYAEMLAGATKPISIRAIVLTTSSNVGGQVALMRAHAIGTGAATGVATAVNHRMGATSAARLQVAWTSSGVTPTGYVTRIRHAIMPIATGSVRELWREEDGPLIVEPASSVLLINHASGIQGAGMHIDVTWEEGPSSDH